jgi:hypothetical protein
MTIGVMKRSSTRTTLLLLCLSVTLLLQAKDFWQEKDYKHWSKQECRKLLQDSPWAKSYSIDNVVIEFFETRPTPGQESNPRITYHVQFRSALPIRQAEIRSAQLQMNYDQLSPEQRSNFDRQAEQYLNVSFADSVAVHVSFDSNVIPIARELMQYWQTKTLEQVKNTTYLVGSDGTLVPPTEFQPYGPGRQEFALLFPRQHEGKPLVGPKDKRISLQFEHPATSELRGGRVLVQFPVKKMLIDGKVIY